MLFCYRAICWWRWRWADRLAAILHTLIEGNFLLSTGQLDIDANLRGIGHVLRDSTLSVPPFQRNYSWTLEEVDEYWYDLRAAISANQPYYFMGTVVVSRDTSEAAVVIDGQQRLATTSLLLAAIRDVLVEGNETSRAATLENRYLIAWSLTHNVEEPRLELNEADRLYFRSAVLNQAAGLPASDRPLLSAAFSRLRSHVKDESESAGPHWVEKLLQWVDFLDKRAQVILMETANDGDAFMVFETLNDRGLPLAVADVIKNYLLGLSRSKLDEASDYWHSAVQAIEDSRSRDSLTDFIRHWWNSRNGATRERDLYSFIRSSIRSEEQALIALRELARQAPYYAALTDPGHPLWEEQSLESLASARVLVDLGLEQYRPLALAALSELAPRDVEPIFRATVNWSVRALIVGGSGGGTAERLYSEAAVRVTNGRSASAESVYGDVMPLVARDQEFEVAFAQRKINRSSTLRYLLRALATGDPTTGELDNLVPVAMFPRSDSSGEWSRIASQDELSNTAGRLGNFMLISRADLKNVPSAPSVKFDYLMEASMRAGGLIAPWSGLEIADVAHRQNEMASKASVIWPLLPDRELGVI